MNILKEDKIQAMIKEIDGDMSYSEMKKNISLLDHYLFKRFCKKKYNVECEPAYCVFRITNNCEYVNAVELLGKEYKIDVLKGVLLDV